MPDDTKDNQSVSPPPGPEKATPSSSSPAADARQSRGSEAAGVPADEAIKDATGKPVTPESGASHPERTSVPPTPEKPPAAPKPPAPAAKPPAPAAEKPAPPPKPAGPTPQPWQSDMVDRFRRRFGSGIDPKTYLGQPYITVDKSIAYEVLQIMR
ncbi:MAG: hypothetical protein JOY79_06765, partial [Acidobacteriaceae bacterium]|nr:hypothetical protein [Acidobacteriaceae bacterium]